MNHRSLAFRLVLSYALLLSAALALVGAGMFYGLEAYLRASLGDSLRRRSEQVQQILARAPADVTNAAIAEQIYTRVAPEFNNRFVRVVRAPGAEIYRSGVPADRSFNPQAVPALPGNWPPAGLIRRVLDAQGQPLLVSDLPINTASGRYLIELGTSLDAIEALQSHLLALLGVLLPVLVLCAAGGGYVLVNWALRPVDRMSQIAAQLSMQNLEAQLPVAPTALIQPPAGPAARFAADLTTFSR
jgi:hypothetical protein